MSNSDLLRKRADNCLSLAEAAEDNAAYKQYVRMALAWKALAAEQAWLDGEIAPIDMMPALRPQPKAISPARISRR